MERKKKHRTKITSLISYSEVLENLGERQALVFKIIRKLKSCNNQMIAKELHLPINSITPRVHELRSFGIVRQHKKDICPYTNKLTIWWKPLRWDF